MTDREKRDIIINGILIPSIQKLYEVDYFNICNGVSERNICSRLAHHMENVMRENDNYNDYYADVEYNRKNDGTTKYYENKLKVSRRMVSDLIVHKRNAEPNLLAVEMKRWNNYDKRKADRDRLESIVSSPMLETRKDDCVYDTTLGAFIIYSPNKKKIEFYENMHRQGTSTGIMVFVCIFDREKFVSLEIIKDHWF